MDVGGTSSESTPSAMELGDSDFLPTPQRPDKPKKDKSKPKNKNDIKTAMSNERTFFKYLWTALHVGTIGTWLLRFYSEPSATEILMVLGTWLVAFILIAFGLFRFYRRRWALLRGLEVDEADSPFGVVFLTFWVTVSVGGTVGYLLLHPKP